ncbi:MAG: hypothetical protein ACRC0G_07590 [Fusobacteriaceae bacterium]
MESNNFYDLVKATAEDLKSRQFSEVLFNDLFASFLNSDTRVECWGKDGLVKTMEPTKEFRNFLTNLLVEYGADIEDAETFMKDYQVSVKSIEPWARPMLDGVINGYLETGKTFQFYPKEDLCASIGIKTIETYEKLYSGSYGQTNVQYQDHRKMYRKSSAPTWKRTSTKVEKKED